MFTNKSKRAGASAADPAIDKARLLALDALDQLQAALDKAESQSAPVIGRVAQNAEEAAHRAIAAIRQGGSRASAYARQSAGQATDYARRNPYKTALLAAVAVASLAAVAGVLSKRSSR